jgi:hypothetical protein
LEVTKYTNQYDGRHPYGIDQYWHCNQCLHNDYGKKSSADEKRQHHYELLKTRIFIPLTKVQLSVEDPNNYQDKLKLSYGVFDLLALPEYEYAREHMDHDIPKDVMKPEQLLEQVKKLGSEIDDYFNNRVRNIVSDELRSKFSDIKIIESGEALTYYTVSFYGLIPKLTRLWIDKVDFSITCNNGLCRISNYIDFASIPALSESKMITTINEIKNNSEIQDSISRFRERRRRILEQTNLLTNSINKKIITEIDHQRYKTKCKACKKYSRWF